MLIDFFYRLKEGGIPVSIKEYLTLVEALDKRVASETVDNFYFLSRASLVKDESHYDRFDKVFADYFNGLESIPADFLDRIPEEWLRKQLELQLSDEEKKLVDSLGGWDKLMETLKKRLEDDIKGALSGLVLLVEVLLVRMDLTLKGFGLVRTVRVIAAPSRFGINVNFVISTIVSRSAREILKLH
jgi:uncharacterized protein with von Willebrand factor type A (vWA) domain